MQEIHETAYDALFCSYIVVIALNLFYLKLTLKPT